MQIQEIDYHQMIQEATQKIMLFPHGANQEKKSTLKFQSDKKLPSSYPFRSSSQIENNMTTTQQIIYQLSQQYPTQLNDNWPKSSIGLVLCEHHQNNQTFYVYGTGILINKNIVLTSAQNVYCRRLNTQYTNIRFIVGVSDDKCSGIYDVKRVHYSKEYTMQEYDNYNFAVLQLYDNLTKGYGYVGLKTLQNIQEDKRYTLYEYINTNQQGFFNLRSQAKPGKHQQPMESCLQSGILVQENNNKCSIVGLQQSKKKYILSEQIRNRINQWTEQILINLYDSNISAQGYKYFIQSSLTHLATIDLRNNNISAQGCKYLSQTNWTHLTQIYLSNNNIDAQGCKYLSQAKWTYLRQILLSCNNIGAQGCKYLSQANWINLTSNSLYGNNIDAQGCKYLSQANWIHMAQIYLPNNNIDAQGCKYLSQSNWTHLTRISLYDNNIDTQGCKYLSQANWTYLAQIQLSNNNIDAQGCNYLSQANWTYLTRIQLSNNNIGAQGCKYLSQTNWTHLTQIYLSCDNIGAQGCKYLSQANWTHLTIIGLGSNNICEIIYQLLLQQSYPPNTIII